MKAIFVRTASLLTLFITTTGLAQVITNVPPIFAPQAGVPGPWQPRALDGFSTEWTRTVIVSNALTGELQSTVERYVAVASGMNYLDNSGVWQPSADQIDIMTNGMGGAGALRGQTKAYFPTTLGDAGSAITLISPKGTVLKIAPLAVYFVDDSSGQSVLLAQMKSGVQGELVGFNQVVYKDAMQGGLACDLRFTYTRGACEADLIINSQPIAPPEAYSLDPNSTRLELVSAVTAPLPTITPIPAVGDQPDFALAYDGGALQFVQGYAFSVAGDPTDSSATPPDAPAQVMLPSAASSDDRVPVAKEFIQMPTAGQWGLGERVKWKDIESKLQALPAYQQHGALSTPERHASLQRQWPALDQPKAKDSRPMKVATAAYRPKGILWDWTTVNSGTTYWFSNSVTYYVAGLCSFTANVTFDPGCTIKFTNGASLYLTGPVTCNGTTANPSVLTSLSDWGFGVRVPGGTGYQTYSAAQAIWLNYTNSGQVLNGLRFRWAQTGLYLSGPSGGGLTHTVTNCLFEWCQTGIFSTNCTAAIQNSTKCTLGTDINGTHTGSLTDVCNGNDSNGLSYSWEHEYFGTNGVSVSADPDGDGLSNQQEYNDGTSPLASDLPQILEQPANQLVGKGYPVTFSVYGVGTGTLTYQWLYNGQSLASATNSSYTISNVQLTNTGNYSVWLTNTCGTNSTKLTLLSSNAFLSVAVSTNAAIPAQQGIISWWKGENNANDSAGTNNGSTSGAVGYSAGKVGQAFNFTNGLTGTVTVSNSSSLNFNTNADFSIEGWIQAQTATNNNYGVQSILDKRYAPDTSDSVGYALYLVYGQLGCQLAQNPLTYAGYANYGPVGPDLRGAFHHVAMTVSRVNPAGGALYVDGTNYLTFNPALEPGDLTTTNSLLIGKHATPGLNCYFGGLIDELAIYNRALSISDVQSIYTVGTAGKYSPPVAPVITNQPQSLSVGPLQSATFSVGVSNATSLTYQWLFNGGAISGATASSYTISSCGFANAGTYAVLVANAGGSAISSNATLTVTNANLPANIVGWWRGEGNATDAVGGNDGKLVGTTFASGEVGQAFSNQYYDYVQVPSSPSLKFTNAFTVEFWYKDTGSEWYQVGLVGKCSPIAYNFDIALWATNSLSVGFWDPAASSVPQALILTNVPQANVFHHVAATYQQAGTNVQMQLYVDGTNSASATVAGNLTNTINEAPLSIGTIVPTAGFFTGLIDEVSIYNRVLTSTEISSIYNAGPAGKCLPPPTAPSLVLQPASQTNTVGTDLFFSGQASGTPPLSYQWRSNNVAIAGATNKILIITNVQSGQAGNYAFVVTNSTGSATSAVAVLTVNPKPSCITAPTNLVGWWKAEGTTRDEIGDDNGTLMSGTHYTNGLVGQAFGFPGFPTQSGVSISSSPSLKLTNAFTVEFWYKDPNGSGGSYGLASKQQISASCSSSYPAGNFLLAMAENYYLQSWVTDPTSGSKGLSYWPVPLAQMYHHLAASYQQISSNIQVILYVDGKSVLTNLFAGTLANCVSDAPLIIGAYNANGDGAFPGAIDELAIYSGVLSATQISSIYNAGAAGKCLTSAAPVITTQPASQSVGVGNEVLMTVYANGTPQLTYQWNYNGTLIPGATGKAYVLSDVQLAQAGNYSVLVTNALGAAMSQTAALTVTSPPPSCTAMPSNMVSWWRAEGNANDSGTNNNNGTLYGSTTFTNAKVGEGFYFNGTSGTYVQVPDSPSLRWFSNAVTAEFWYKDTGSSALCALVSKASSSSPSGTFAVALVPNTCLAIYFGDATFGGQWLAYAPIPAAGMFHHVAVTYQQNGLNQVSANLYIDGQCARSGTFVGNLTNTFSSAPMVIGAFDNLGDWPFTGIVDELTLYNRALAIGEIQAIFNAGVSGKCTTNSYGAVGITITSPTNLQSFTAVATNVPLQATVSDNLGGSVTNVQFFFGPISSTSLIASTSTASSTNANVYNLTWVSNLWVGNYPITAVAKDNKGGTNASQIVLFKVNPTNGFPYVAITNPASGAVFPAGANLTLMATANGSNSVPITNVEFFQNSIPLGNDQIAPYQIDSLGLTPGTYTFFAQAQDSNGLSSVSQPITVTVPNWKTVSGSGYWDAEFQAGSFFDLRYDDAAAACVDSSNCVFVSTSQGNASPRLGYWQSCGWTVPPNLGNLNAAIETLQYRSPYLYAGGGNGVQSWTWSGQINDLTYGLDSTVWTLQFIKGELYAGGEFTTAGTNTAVQYIGELVGNAWIPVGNGLNGTVHAIASIGDTIYAGGEFTAAGSNTNIAYVAELVGTNWVALGSGVTNIVRALAVWNGKLLVGGDFTQAGGNTNASGIALWDGASWSSIGSGVATPGTNSVVKSIAVWGNDVFVGGVFNSVQNTTNVLSSTNVAQARWDVDQQRWVWTAMDLGVSLPGYQSRVDFLAIRPNSSSNGLDLIAAGSFSQAGLLPSIATARWVISDTDCTNTRPPTVTFPFLPDGSTFYGVTSLQLQADAFAVQGAQVLGLNFYSDGAFIGSGSNGGSGSTYSFTWTTSSGLTNGVHRLDAVAWDSQGLTNKATVTISINPNGTPSLGPDTYTLYANDPPTPLYVLTNDSNVKAISSVSSLQGDLGTVGIAPGATNLIYSPAANTYGQNTFFYTATNSSGASASTIVSVTILSRPFVQITAPGNGLNTNTPVTLAISGTTLGYDGTVTNIQILTNGVLYTSVTPSGNSFGANWTAPSDGFYSFVAIATDNYGSTSSSPTNTIDVITVSTNIHAPFADIYSPTNSLNSVGSLAYRGTYMVTSGQLSVTGNAYSPDAGATVAWQLLLLDPSNPTTPPLYNVTPGPLNAQGFHAGAIQNASFGNCDLSLVQNGNYSLTLVVQSEGLQTMTDVTIQVASNLKIGQFSFSEQDLVIPVNGIPLTVVRTYNSLNPLSTDFGYGWTFSINSMDVQLDDERTPVIIGVSPEALSAFPTEEDAYGAPLATSIRTGGGRDVTLTLPDGRRTTFLFSPTYQPSLSQATASWVAPPDVHANLGVNPPGSATINLLLDGSAYWQDNTWPSTFDYHDIPGFVLTNYDGAQYFIDRGLPNVVYYTPNPSSPGYWANTYGPPLLTRILQRSGDLITISSNGISHSISGSTNRTVSFTRDGSGRIITINDPNAGTSGFLAIKYAYDNLGNLVQVQKLLDRNAGTYSTNRYIYGNSAFPHYITEIDNGIGVPITRNFYDASGRLIATVDANNNTNQFIHNLTNSLEVVVDPLGHTNTFGYDSRGNVTAVTNALGGITINTYDNNNNKISQVAYTNGAPYATSTFGYDPTTGLLTASTNGLGFTNSFAYNSFGQMTNVIDARGSSWTNYFDGNGNLTGTSDPLGITTANFYDSNGLLTASKDALGNLTTNFYDGSGNLTGTASFSNSVTLLLTNSFGYDLNGNRTNSTVWRKVNGAWTGAPTAYIYDGQNRVIQTIDPDGGTNIVVFDAAGRPQQKIDKLGRVTGYTYDFGGRLIQTTYPDHTTEAFLYDPAGNRTNTVDRANRPTTYIFDALNHLKQTIFSDNTTNMTVYDDLGRVTFSVDARGITNAFGYDAAGRRVAATNGWGAGVAMVSLYGFDANGNQIYFTNALGRVTTNVFDALNRQMQVLYADGTKVSTGFDIAGRRVAVTNQDSIVTRFGYDGLGRLLAVTNGIYSGQVTNWAQFQYDEAGNETAQIDALNRTNLFAYDGLGRRISHTMPGGQSESFTYDFAGNVTYYTSFNGAAITNQYDLMDRLTNRTSINGYKASFVYSATGKQTIMTDTSGTTSYTYDNRDRLTNKVVSWTAGPTLSLNYRFDANGNLTNLWSSSSGGVTNFYQFDALNRLTNVVANGSAAVGYGYDGGGNLQAMRYGNGVTNQFQYDVLNRLTNVVWKTNAGTVASFYYQLGATGNRTNLTETLISVITNRTYAWTYDLLYRLKQETLSGGVNATLSYGFDAVGNRTNRTVTGSLNLTNQPFTFNTNDWMTSDGYDNNGNTTSSFGNSYQYDVLNHLTNVNSGAVLIWYDGDGSRTKKTVGSTTTYYLLDDQNPSGCVQVLEEWTGTTTLSRVYNYGLRLISQRQPNTSTNYFAFDGHGSTRMLIDSGTNVVNVFTFDAYGNLIASNAAPQTAYLFAGEQWDSDLGFYYNRARFYNQGIGRFATRDTDEGNQEDPLSLHKYAYAADDPVNKIDPLGRSFFAFDGTSNWEGEKDAGVVSPTNVRKMYLASLDPHKYYERGVGNAPDNQDAWGYGGGLGFGAGMSKILKDASQWLQIDRKNGDHQVDIIGFSRGGIEAIEFANRVAQAYPDETIRFVGLFDPVGSVGMPGSFGGYHHSLPPGVQHSSVAYALDETRAWFPATWVEGAVPGYFRGVHSDIGGGFADHRLSDVALVWMYQQAKSAGVPLDLSLVVAAGFPITPDASAPIHRNSGFTSWFNEVGGRAIIGEGWTISPGNGLSVNDLMGF